METWGLRLKDTVTEGNSPWWFTTRGAVALETWATAPSGTDCPVALFR